MTVLAPFPDPQQAVADVSGAVAGVAVSYAGSRTLAAIKAGKLPAVRAVRTGDAGSDRYTDRSAVSVAVFAGDAGTALSLAQSCQQELMVRGIGTAHGLIDLAETLDGPRLVTSPDVTAVQCATASYRVSMRR